MTMQFADPKPQALPEQIRWELLGDKEKADSLRGLGLQLMGQLKAENVHNYALYYKQVEYKDGVKVLVQRQKQIFVDLYTISIYHPSDGKINIYSDLINIKKIQKNEFYCIPGCVARYDIKKYWSNNIKYGILKDEVIGRGTSVQVTIDHKNFGLPLAGISPDGVIARDYGVISLPGDSTASTDISSILELSQEHIPAVGPFSISCIARLNKNIEIDYSFSEKTNELCCGYTVYNQVKARILQSSNGVDWTAECPGSIAPLLGLMIPSRFSDHFVSFTYPWPEYNDNFVSSKTSLIGYREIDSACRDEPLLATEYDKSSPYWDKYEADGENTITDYAVMRNWEENSEVLNLSPYVSYSQIITPVTKFKGLSAVDMANKRVSGISNQDNYYGTVESYYFQPAASPYLWDVEYSNEQYPENVVYVLKDYMYKVGLNNNEHPLQFKDIPFPCSNEKGFLIGIDYIGLFWHNKNKILAGKICDFQNEYKFDKIITEEVDINCWYHICMTCGVDGGVSLYVTKLNEKSTSIYKNKQSSNQFYGYDGFFSKMKINSGTAKWKLSHQIDSPPSDWSSSWVYSADMDIALPRFYHRELSKNEVKLLLAEAFKGTFVADDFEAAQLVGLGYKPIMV